MNEAVNLKLDELIKYIKSHPKVLELKQIKEEIYADEDLRLLLNEFEKIKKYEYSAEYVSLKSKIIENSKVIEYRKLENELYFTILEMNKRLNSLIDRRKC